MKKIAALFLVFSAGLLSSCGLLGDGMADPETNYWYTARTHAPMYMEIHLRCPYDSACTSNVTFGYVVQTMQKDGRLYSAEDFSYTFVSDEDTGTVKLGSLKPLLIHDDGHVRFSLFDSTHAEKSYDIDLSGVTHFWTRRGDSVDVVIPEGYTMAIMEKEKGLLGFSGDTLPDRTVTLPFDGKWNNYFYLDEHKGGQSSYGTDSVYITTDAYWCFNPDPLSYYYCRE